MSLNEPAFSSQQRDCLNLSRDTTNPGRAASSPTRLRASVFLVLLILLTTRSTVAQDGVQYVDSTGFRDCLVNGKPVWRHMNAFDEERLAETYKPFTHVFAADGKQFITKGAGGKFTHHRGLFLGFNKTKTENSGGDFWHCKGVTIRFRKYDGNTIVNEWVDKNGTAIVRDQQTITTKRLADSSLQLDFDISIESLDGTATLKGDPQHAGFQFRAHNGLASNDKKDKSGSCRYLRPKSAHDKGNDVWHDCPWVVGTFQFADKTYSVQHMNHPSNPKFDSTVYSTRGYGRFGAFAEHSVKQGAPLKLRYRISIANGEADADVAAKRYAGYSGT